jgi:hypothetical protein
VFAVLASSGAEFPAEDLLLDLVLRAQGGRSDWDCDCARIAEVIAIRERQTAAATRAEWGVGRIEY